MIDKTPRVAGEDKSFEFLLFCGEKDNQLVSKKKERKSAVNLKRKG